jgi:competence protein ComEA
MFNLKRYEKTIILFLVLTLLLGLAITTYKRSHSGMRVTVANNGGNVETNAVSGGNYLPEGRKININEAGIDELMKIRGLGKVLAGRIAEYRSQKGLFVSIEDIKNVKGVGPALFEKIKDRISVE